MKWKIEDATKTNTCFKMPHMMQLPSYMNLKTPKERDKMSIEKDTNEHSKHTPN